MFSERLNIQRAPDARTFIVELTGSGSVEILISWTGTARLSAHLVGPERVDGACPSVRNAVLEEGLGNGTLQLKHVFREDEFRGIPMKRAKLVVSADSGSALGEVTVKGGAVAGISSKNRTGSVAANTRGRAGLVGLYYHLLARATEGVRSSDKTDLDELFEHYQTTARLRDHDENHSSKYPEGQPSDLKRLVFLNQWYSLDSDVRADLCGKEWGSLTPAEPIRLDKMKALLSIDHPSGEDVVPVDPWVTFRLLHCMERDGGDWSDEPWLIFVSIRDLSSIRVERSIKYGSVDSGACRLGKINEQDDNYIAGPANLTNQYSIIWKILEDDPELWFQFSISEIVNKVREFRDTVVAQAMLPKPFLLFAHNLLTANFSVFIDSLIGSDAVSDDSIGTAQNWTIPVSWFNAIDLPEGAQAVRRFMVSDRDATYRVSFGVGRATS